MDVHHFATAELEKRQENFLSLATIELEEGWLSFPLATVELE